MLRGSENVQMEMTVTEIFLKFEMSLFFSEMSFNYFEWVTEGLLIFIFGVVGLFGNGVSVYTFWRQRVHRIFHNLLLSLAIFDMVSN